MSGIIVDGVTYDLPWVAVTEKIDKLYKYAERNEAGTLLSELIGVFYNFDVQIAESAANPTDYALFWAMLKTAKTSYQITMPDPSGDLTYYCYFSNIQHGLIKQKGTTNYFRGLSFSIIAISPAVVPA